MRTSLRRDLDWFSFHGAVLLLAGLWAEAVTWVQIQLVSDFEVTV